MIKLQDVEKELSKRFPNGFNSLADIPQPSLLKDSKKASKRVIKAIENGERITVIGDYDVDGITSSSIIYLFFKELGVDIDIVIPNRFKDGYGITPQLLERVEADLVITVDNGIHAFNSAKILKERGVDFIITDHHNPSDTLPDAFAIVNPKQSSCQYPYKEICGAEVIWLLLAEVKRELEAKIDMNQYLDLLAIATIADVMPITGINHAIVKAGLKLFSKKRRVANQILFDRVFVDRESISSEDIAFQIAPRLNSSGRMDDAIHSFKFLTSDNYLEAVELFEKIDSLNIERKEIEKAIFQDVASSVDTSKSIIIYYGENLHEGVIGIVASRIVEKFQKPAFIFSQNGDILRGSGRSLGNIDMFYLLTEASHLLLKWGGHKMAGGLSMKLENIDEFKRIIYKAMERYTQKDFINESQVFGELDLNDVSLELCDILDRFEPFGNGNERPIFSISDARVKNSYRIGKSGEYQKLIIEKNLEELEVVVFQDIEDIEVGRNISFIYKPNKSTFRDEVTIQAFLKKMV